MSNLEMNVFKVKQLFEIKLHRLINQGLDFQENDIWGVNFHTLGVNSLFNCRLTNLKIVDLRLSFERYRDNFNWSPFMIEAFNNLEIPGVWWQLLL